MRRLECVFGMLMFYLGAFGQAPLEFVHNQMGTQFRILISGEDSAKAKEVASNAFDRLDRLNEIFSDYLPDSELNRLSAQSGSGKELSISPELWEVLSYSLEVSQLSQGAFDVSIGPLSLIWRRAFRRQEFPGSSEVQTALNRVGYPAILLAEEGKTIKLDRVGMRLDLGGIAKGYAVDAMAEVLQKEKIKRFLIDGGGDLYAAKPPKDKNFWKIALADGTLIDIKKAALATSGDRYQYLEWKEKRYSHLIDPRTGYGVSHGLTVTVLAATCLKADAWASTLSILGNEGNVFLQKYLKKKKVQHWFYKIGE